ncbi:MAG TPA: hypothetical protein VF885_05360 [Arthrobacter sp.]
MPAFLGLERDEFLNSAHVVDFAVGTKGGDNREGVMNGNVVFAAVAGEDSRRVVARQLTETDARALVGDLVKAMSTDANSTKIVKVADLRSKYPIWTFPTHEGWEDVN